jgi:hypothetical protein
MRSRTRKQLAPRRWNGEASLGASPTRRVTEKDPELWSERMQEQWRSISGFPGYEASDQGRIRSIRSVIRPHESKTGYLSVKICIDGSYTHLKVHRAVLLAFRGRPKDGEVAAHNDGNKKNNTLSNLRWASRSLNERDKIRHGTSNRGGRNGQAKLSERDVAIIHSRKPRCMAECRRLASQFNVRPLTIYKVATGRRWGHALDL